VYCAGCRVRLAARPDPGEPPPRKARRSSKARGQGTDVQQDAQREDFRSSAQIEYLEGVAAMEVGA
jgi:hypothetical protein